MKTKVKNKNIGIYTETKHFLRRRRERKIPFSTIKSIIEKMDHYYNLRFSLIVPNKILKELHINHLGENLILIIEGCKLITIFPIKNFGEYLSNHRNGKCIILNA